MRSTRNLIACLLVLFVGLSMLTLGPGPAGAAADHHHHHHLIQSPLGPLPDFQPASETDQAEEERRRLAWERFLNDRLESGRSNPGRQRCRPDLNPNGPLRSRCGNGWGGKAISISIL